MERPLLDFLIKTPSGMVPTSEIPAVKKESASDRNKRLILSFVIMLLIGVLFVVFIAKRDEKLQTMNMVKNIAPINKLDVEQNMRNYVMGRYIQIHCNNPETEIKYVVPIFSSQKPYSSSSDTGFYKHIGASHDDVEPIISIDKQEDKIVYTIDVQDDRPISRIAITTPNDDEKLELLKTCKVIIRDSELLKVWQSCSYLKPEELNIVNVNYS